MIQIKGLQRLEETIQRTGGSGDNWHMTWAGNDAVFTSLCDGKGWTDIAGHTGKDYNSRVFSFEGTPEQTVFRHLEGFPDLQNEWGTRLASRYYGFGILALDHNIYHFMSTPNHPFFEKPEPRFVGAKLIYSPDLGQSWKNQDGSSVVWESWEERNRENMAFFCEPDDAFSLITVLQMGKNYEHNRDGFVYLYAPNGNTEGTMNQLALCRVPKDKILDRSAYDFFVSLRADGSAVWSSRIEERGVVHTFPSGWVNTKLHPYAWHPSVVYNAGLDVYMMANWGMGIDEKGEWFAKPSYLGVWIAEQPWGPWSQIHEETAWTPAGDEKARAYQPQIAPSWIAEDGKSFYLVWTDFQTIDKEKPYYCFNCQKVNIIL